MMVDVHFDMFDEDPDDSREPERVFQTVGESRRKTEGQSTTT